MSTQAASDKARVESRISDLLAAWNAGDGTAYGECFTEDADFVVVNGAFVQSRPHIVAGHDEIFRGVYRNSVNQGTVEQVRFLSPDIAVAHVRLKLRFKPGPEWQEANARATLVLTKDSDWRIAVFQNTPIAEAGPMPNIPMRM